MIKKGRGEIKIIKIRKNFIEFVTFGYVKAFY